MSVQLIYPFIDWMTFVPIIWSYSYSLDINSLLDWQRFISHFNALFLLIISLPLPLKNLHLLHL